MTKKELIQSWQRHKRKILFCLPPLLIGIFVYNLLSDAGLFREVTNYGLELCRPEGGITGPEDFAYSPSSSTVFISSDFRPDGGGLGDKQGSIWGLNPETLEKVNLTPDLSFEFHPHGLGIHEGQGGTWLYVVNHAKDESSVEVFEWKEQRLIHLRSIKDKLMINPNDIHPVGKDKFYLSHDHGSKVAWMKKVEAYTRMGRGYVTYYDGQKFRKVDGSISYANGLVATKNGKHLFVASMLSQKILMYEILQDGGVEHLRSIATGSSPDNLALDDDGNLWVSSHVQAFDLKNHMLDHDHPSSFEVLKVPVSDGYEKVEQVMMNDGKVLSGASVAFPVHGKIFIGSIYQDMFLVCLME